jgi:hypothetical protein
VKRWSVHEQVLQMMLQSRKLESWRHIDATPIISAWSSLAFGDYDTDEECEERNTIDDMIKMIEGDWD